MLRGPGARQGLAAGPRLRFPLSIGPGRQRLSAEQGRCYSPAAVDQSLLLRVVLVGIAYLAGSTIDYCDDLTGTGFRIHNPKAVRSCGCGTSFEAETAASEAHQH